MTDGSYICRHPAKQINAHTVNMHICSHAPVLQYDSFHLVWLRLIPILYRPVNIATAARETAHADKVSEPADTLPRSYLQKE